MRRIMTLTATLALAVASALLPSALLASPASALGRPAGSSWTAFPGGRLLVDTGRDLSELAGGQLRTLVTGSTFQRKYGSFPRNGRTIVYSDVGRRGFGVQLWVRNTESGDRRQITALTAETYGARFSPDGTQIAFQTAASGEAAIWLVNVDGSNAHQLSTPGAYYGPGISWSPAGSELVVTRARRDQRSGEPYDWQLVTLRADGTKETALTSADGDKNSPAWSPDGATIVFSYLTAAGMRAGTQYELWAMRSDGTGLRRLTHTPNVSEQAAVFSPDGTALAYASWPSDATVPQVMRAKADGTAATVVPANGYPMSWSAD